MAAALAMAEHPHVVFAGLPGLDSFQLDKIMFPAIADHQEQSSKTWDALDLEQSEMSHFIETWLFIALLLAHVLPKEKQMREGGYA